MNRENILATISDLKEELDNIEKTKHQIETSLQMLSQLLRSPFLTSGSTTIEPAEKKSRRTIFPVITQKTEGGPVASTRVHSVLDGMQGRFTRAELYRNSNSDGNGLIAPGTFANIFSKLIKREQIVCVEGSPGQRDSIYMKQKEVIEQPTSNSLSHIDLFK